jgi:hypothetical protein
MVETTEKEKYSKIYKEAKELNFEELREKVLGIKFEKIDLSKVNYLELKSFDVYFRTLAQIFYTKMICELERQNLDYAEIMKKEAEKKATEEKERQAEAEKKKTEESKKEEK